MWLETEGVGDTSFGAGLQKADRDELPIHISEKKDESGFITSK